MGLSNSALDQGLTYLRRERIHAFREHLGQTTREPRKPDLTSRQWTHTRNLFERGLKRTQQRLTLPPVFTAIQTHIAQAILLMFDVMGPEAQTSVYEDIQAIIRTGLTTVNGSHGTVPNVRTIATVLGAFEQTGAVKYIRGHSGTRSTLILVDLHWLTELRERPRVHSSYSIPTLHSDIRVGSPLPTVVSPYGSQVFNFSFYRLLRDLYSGASRGVQSRVTREFTTQLTARGLARRKLYDEDTSYGPHGTYTRWQWSVDYTDDQVADLEIAVRETYRKFQRGPS